MLNSDCPEAQQIRNHASKADARLTEIDDILLPQVDTAILVADTRARELPQQLATLNNRRLLPLTPEEHRLWEQEMRALRSRVEGIRPIQQALNARRNVLLRSRGAILQPITLLDFQRSPIRRVPADILLEIFQSAERNDIPPLGEGSVLLLSQICSRWRAVACDNPLLWSSFSFSLTGTQGAADLLRLYLERSRACRLMVEIRFTPHHNTSRPRSLITVPEISLLAAHFDRLHTVRFSGNFFDAFDLRPFCANLPRLEILEFPPETWDSSGDIFVKASALWSLALTDAREHGCSPGIPRAQIRTLRLSNGANPEGLATYSNLTSLTCTLHCQLGPETYRGTTALLPQLTSWKIYFTRMDAVPLGFFDGFTTPALEKLEVTCLQRPSHLAALVQRSQCDLKTLVLRRGSVRISELLDVFELSPHITSFMLTNGCSTSITDRLLEALMIRDDRLNLLPKLNRLVIDGSYVFTTGKLVEMLETRASRAEPALDARTYVDLTLQDRPVEKDNVGRLRGLQGIKVSLHCLLDELDNVNLVGIL